MGFRGHSRKKIEKILKILRKGTWQEGGNFIYFHSQNGRGTKEVRDDWELRYKYYTPERAKRDIKEYMNSP